MPFREHWVKIAENSVRIKWVCSKTVPCNDHEVFTFPTEVKTGSDHPLCPECGTPMCFKSVYLKVGLNGS